MAVQVNPFMLPMFDPKGAMTSEWLFFFHELLKNLDTSGIFSLVLVPNVSGSGYVVDTFKYSKGHFVVYFYYAQSGTNVRGGILQDGWNDDGTLAAEHGERDIQDIGDTSDLTFAFELNSTTNRIQWLATSTQTYRIVALRILI